MDRIHPALMVMIRATSQTLSQLQNSQMMWRNTEKGSLHLWRILPVLTEQKWSSVYLLVGHFFKVIKLLHSSQVWKGRSIPISKQYCRHSVSDDSDPCLSSS